MHYKRKLVRKNILSEIHEFNAMGVPLTVLLRKHQLDISRPHLAKLVDYYTMYISDELSDDTTLIIGASLFPEWLRDYNDDIQVSPNDWGYVGTFPFGVWCKSDNTNVKVFTNGGI